MWIRARAGRLRHFSNADVDSPHHGFERNPGVFPRFDQRPVKRREQKQSGAASALEMLLDLGEVVEVVLAHVRPAARPRRES